MTDDVPPNVAGHEGHEDPRGQSDDDGGRDDGEEPDLVADAEEPDPVADAEEPDLVAEVEPSAEGADEAVDELDQPVELLVQLARDGEIDPWDIDIVEVTDKFLARLSDSDLRVSARALFYASVLLRMKGDVLLAEDEPDEPVEQEPWELPPGEALDVEGDPIDSLEAEMERRLERKRVRGQPETLEELVHELRDAERDKWWKEARTYDTSDSPAGFRRGTQTLDYHSGDEGRMAHEPTEADVTGTTHEEDIEAVIDDVRAALREQYDKGREEVLYAEIENAGGSRVMTYLALLFLAHRGEIYLRQDELFGDLWVRNASLTTGTGEAVAD